MKKNTPQFEVFRRIIRTAFLDFKWGFLCLHFSFGNHEDSDLNGDLEIVSNLVLLGLMVPKQASGLTILARFFAGLPIVRWMNVIVGERRPLTSPSSRVA